MPNVHACIEWGERRGRRGDFEWSYVLEPEDHGVWSMSAVSETPFWNCAGSVSIEPVAWDSLAAKDSKSSLNARKVLPVLTSQTSTVRERKEVVSTPAKRLSKGQGD